MLLLCRVAICVSGESEFGRTGGLMAGCITNVHGNPVPNRFRCPVVLLVPMLTGISPGTV